MSHNIIQARKTAFFLFSLWYAGFGFASFYPYLLDICFVRSVSIWSVHEFALIAFAGMYKKIYS